MVTGSAHTMFITVVFVCTQINPDLVEKFESNNMIFVGHDEGGQRMEMLELKGELSVPQSVAVLLEYYHK